MVILVKFEMFYMSFISYKLKNFFLRLLFGNPITLERIKREYIFEQDIEKYKKKFNQSHWNYISKYQILSESFIEKYKNELDWNCVLTYQKLSEPFIEKYKSFYTSSCWSSISRFQKLSVSFIRKYKYLINWNDIVTCQNIPIDLIYKCQTDKNKVNKLVSKYERSHKKKTYEEKLKEIKVFAEKFGLKYDDEYLYAYRRHDKSGRGYLSPYPYESHIYYKDWHCDIDSDNLNSCGFGIWGEYRKGHKLVRIKIDDWGVYLGEEFKFTDKARVWGFEIC